MIDEKTSLKLSLQLMNDYESLLEKYMDSGLNHTLIIVSLLGLVIQTAYGSASNNDAAEELINFCIKQGKELSGK